jgi:predicted TIM-barrel fold metal-dependent hydrolase
LYADISAQSGYNALTRDVEFSIKFLNEFQDRLLFGTDVCFGDEEGRTNHLRLLRDFLSRGAIDREVFEKITYKNALKVMERRV